MMLVVEMMGISLNGSKTNLYVNTHAILVTITNTAELALNASE